MYFSFPVDGYYYLIHPFGDDDDAQIYYVGYTNSFAYHITIRPFVKHSYNQPIYVVLCTFSSSKPYVYYSRIYNNIIYTCRYALQLNCVYSGANLLGKPQGKFTFIFSSYYRLLLYASVCAVCVCAPGELNTHLFLLYLHTHTHTLRSRITRI